MKLQLLTLSASLFLLAHPHAYAGEYVEIASRSCAYLEEDMPKHTECVSNFLKQTCESIREAGNLSEAKNCYEDAALFLTIRVQEFEARAQYHEYEAKRLEEERTLLREDTNRRIEALRAKIK